MGCDIHGYIEYKEDDSNNYYNFCNEFSDDRDYVMFGILAGVRRDGCLYSPRGIPKDISWRTLDGYCLFIVDNETDTDNYCTREQSIRWVLDGSSEYWDKEHKWITHPDWHTPSWLTTEEYENVLNKRKEYEWNYSPEWDAILAAMKSLPNARFVFWFDN